MKVFIHNEDFSALQAQLLGVNPDERLPLLVEVAWHLRQRDSLQALQLASQAEQLLNRHLPQDANFSAQPQLTQQVALRAWLAALRGEARFLLGEAAESRQLLRLALQDFDAIQLHAGCSDVLRTLALLATDAGDARQNEELLQQAIAQAESAQDPVRLQLAQAALGIADALRDPDAALERWQHILRVEQAGPIAAAAIHHFYGYCRGLKSDLAASISHWISAHDLAMRSGQHRIAISSASNVGVAFNSLNEHHAAMEWIESALEHARRNRWPTFISLGLLQTAETMRHQGHLDPAAPLLDEAELGLARTPDSRNYALALTYQGELAQDRGDPAGALDFFQRARERAQTLGHQDLVQVAERGIAQALLALGQAPAALQSALRAQQLALQRQDAYSEIAALKVLAQIHATHRLAGPAGVGQNDLSLHYLEQAQNLAHGIAGYLVGDSLPQALAQEYARRGQYLRAYQTICQANQDRDKAHRQEVTNRAVAMRVQHQTASAMAESEHHRRLALTEAKRAAVLQQTSDTLERLCQIGGELASKLELDVLYEALARHVQDLLNPHSFSLWLKDADGQHVQLMFALEQGERQAGLRRPLNQLEPDMLHCLQHRAEVLQDRAADLLARHVQPGSALLAPLAVGERVFGLCCVQALRRHAFGERERLVFRTLCAYASIALDNANAYRQLHDAREHLVNQEKLAALGSLVAGVAHELNTPLGNCLMITSALQGMNQNMLGQMDAPGIRRADLDTFLAEHGEATAVIMRGLSSATELINSFKQVALDRSTAQRRVFNLLQTSRDILATLASQIRHAGRQIQLEMPDDIELTSYPGPYGQIINNLVNNALLHAFDDGRSGGNMLLRAQRCQQRQQDWVEIVFEDDGVGIPPGHLKRIFDPFFTTKMGQGGSGLGMSICYNLATQILQGKIRVESEVGRGARFILELPLFVAAEN
ncbi:ATP-binding protein [Massilia sp. W12]|uniref:ATP-binding protein n=1 Tax=Massilia sp. W12 TaxID=3126507 RepID=UPI0030D26F22